MDYRSAGVDRDRAAEAIHGIARHARRTQRPEQINLIGGFAGAMALPAGYQEPVILASADGVGTKLMLLRQQNKWHTAGVDLVAMNVNDLLAQGGEPLFFLDYVASGRLDPDIIVQIAAGIADACIEAGCTLLGGETAEMPGLLQQDQLELAGFAVGVCEREHLVVPERVRPGDVVIGLASTGAHSNGYSLIRQVLKQTGLVDEDGTVDASYRPGGWDRPLLDVLLEPTRIYVKPVREVFSPATVRAMAHITGGGLPDNLERVLPPGLGIVLDPGAWPVPLLFQWLAEAGNIKDEDMYRTFNMGIGFALVVDRDSAGSLCSRLAASLGAPAWIIGEVIEGSGVSGLWQT